MAQPNYPYQGGEQQPPVPPPYGGVQYPGGAAPPMPPAAPPPKKSNVGKIVLIILAVLLVLCAGGGAAAYFLLRDRVEAASTRVVAPETLAGRSKVTQPELQTASDTLVANLKTNMPDATSTVGAFYGDVLAGDLIMIAAVSGIVANPGAEVDKSFSDMSSAGMAVTNIQSVDPGPLGGEAKCGDGTSQGLSLGICSWADLGSIGMIVMYNKTGAEAATEFVEIRGAIEQQG